MNLLGIKVSHKFYGEGEVVSLDENLNRITIRFQVGEKVFGYPQCFQKYLEVLDNNLKPILEQKIKEYEQKIQILHDEELSRWRERAKVAEIERAAKTPRLYPRKNIAFKCTFCDGGKSDSCYGFNGICSDKQMRCNVQIDKRTWCSAEENPCKMYLDGKLTKAQLQEKYDNNNASICYESNLLRAWNYGAGIVVRGINKGKPNTLRGVQTNSLCVLTSQEKKSNKMQRYIFGVFLVIRAEEGDEYSEGKVIAHPKYRIALNEQEAHQMCFWNYYKNDSEKAPYQWGTGLFRYVDDKTALQILKDIVCIKRGTECEQDAKEMLDYFLNINHLKFQAD